MTPKKKDELLYLLVSSGVFGEQIMPFFPLRFIADNVSDQTLCYCREKLDVCSVFRKPLIKRTNPNISICESCSVLILARWAHSWPRSVWRRTQQVE
jgi:hypothetical protein